MLTGKMLRVRYARERILPYYLDLQDSNWNEVAEHMLEIYRHGEGQPRSVIEDSLHEAFGDDPSQVVHQGLAKLLDDRCDYEVVAGHPPEKLREAVFRTAASRRRTLDALMRFEREEVLLQVGTELGLSADEIEQGLFADLKTEQRLIAFKDLTATQLLQRYNVALAQAVLYKAIRLAVTIRNEPPQRYRQLLRRLKFHRLLCEMERVGPDSYVLHLDGPLSLFSATVKYGLQLALFLPAVLLCRDFEVKAELRWGTQRKPKTFLVKPSDGLVSHYLDTGMYVPAEVGMFAELFAKRVKDWELITETEAYPLGNHFWVPDFRLVHRSTKKVVRLEILGFWRKSSAEKHLKHLRLFNKEPFLLAVSDQLRIEEGSLEDLSAGIHRFRHMPLPEEIARLATALVE